MMLAIAAILAFQSLPAAAPPSPLPSPPPSQSICNQPVVMVVAGPTLDRERMLAYGKAIADSKLYEKLGGYYVNIPRELDRFEGEPPAGYTTLIVRFPCLENAQAFWNSRVYQEEIKPLRLNPSAGDYVVTVYPEAPMREDMVGKAGDARYTGIFPAQAIEQAE